MDSLLVKISKNVLFYINPTTISVIFRDMKSILILCLCLLAQSNCSKNELLLSSSDPIHGSDNIKGLNFVAPPDPFSQNPMPAVQQVNAEWIAVIPYAFTRVNEPTVRYNMTQWQWWGERVEGVKETIRLAKEAGIKIMLKPQVYIPGSWPGGLDFNNEDWVTWEKAYTEYIQTFVEIAQELEVEMFCVGTEFKKSSSARSFFWEKLIQEIRQNYSGQLTYAANWDEYQQITFWDQLDFIGIDAYFPLVNEKTPTVEQLTTAWLPITRDLQSTFDQWQRPILFTEFGYLTVDRCAYNTWELEANVTERNINQQAQANAYDGLFKALWNTEFWAGGFVWKWFPNMQGHENYPERDYSPQGKLSEQSLSNWYSK